MWRDWSGMSGLRLASRAWLTKEIRATHCKRGRLRWLRDTNRGIRKLAIMVSCERENECGRCLPIADSLNLLRLLKKSA